MFLFSFYFSSGFINFRLPLPAHLVATLLRLTLNYFSDITFILHLQLAKCTLDKRAREENDECHVQRVNGGIITSLSVDC